MTDIAPSLFAALGGRYRIERELGAGGMTGYLAEDSAPTPRSRQGPVAFFVTIPRVSSVPVCGRGPLRFVERWCGFH